MAGEERDTLFGAGGKDGNHRFVSVEDWNSCKLLAYMKHQFLPHREHNASALQSRITPFGKRIPVWHEKRTQHKRQVKRKFS